MKRIISVLLAIIMLFGIIPLNSLTAFAANDAIVSVESVSAVVGSTVDVVINISNNPGIASMGFSMSFDENLTLVAATNGAAFSELAFTPPAQLKKGGTIKNSCKFSWVSSDNATADGAILKLKFKVDENTNLNKVCPITITFSDGDVNNKDRNPVSVNVKNGAVTVIDYIPGDVDGSGIINMFDVLTLCQYYVDGCKYDSNGYAIDIKSERGDVDANGKITMLDVLMICQYYVDGCKYDPNGYAVKLLPGKAYCEHNLVKIDEVLPTCTKDGNIAYWHCTKCDEYYSDASASNVITLESTVLKASHNEIIKPAIPATSTSEGYTEGVWCDRCKTWISGHERIEPIKPNTKSITYNIVNEAEHPYLKTIKIDTSDLIYSYEPGERKTLKNLELGKYGYTFEGWYDGFGSNATQIKEITEADNENIILYAHVKENEYSITYNLYQTPVTSSPTDSQMKYKVSKGNANLYTPTINNYKFLGWYDDNGVEYKTIPVGTTGNITLNAYYTSLRNLAVSKEDDNPLILEDQNTNVVYFTYEIGEIRNIPLNGDKPFWEVQSVAGLSQQASNTYTTSVTDSEASSVSKTISDMTTNSSTWTLAKNWNNVTTVNETWAKSIGKTTEQCRTDATTSSSTLSVSAQNGGSSFHKNEDGSTVYNYNTKTTTKDKGHQFDASLSGNYTNKVGANLGSSTEFGATSSYGYSSKSKNNEFNGSGSSSDKDVLSAGIKYENGFEVNAGLNYGYHNNTKTVTKTGTDKVKTSSKIDENTSSWNNSAGFSSTQQNSSSQSVRNALSDVVTTTKGYGSSYSNGGTDSKTQGFSSTSSNTSGTTSSVTYSKNVSEIKTKTYSVDGNIEGRYRSIMVGKAHVFAVVGYDYATKSFFTYTFSVMDDKVEEFLDYTPKGSDFDDCENSCLPFEIPYFVFEYVNEKTSKTTGVQYITNSLNGTAKITGYVGDSTDVIIPSYVSDGKQAYKVTEISEKAFAGKPIRSVVIGEFIKTIPNGAFKNCANLEEVIGSFTEIGNEAFAGCVNLTNMNIPSNVVSIGTNAFTNVKSINVRAINSLSSYAEAVKLLPEGTDNQLLAKQKEITQRFVKTVLECGAKNIVLDISLIAKDTPLSLNVPKMESIEINGGRKTYDNFSIDSYANNTTLNEITINNSNGTPIKTDSIKTTLHKVFVDSTSTSIVLKKDGAVLSLVQDSAIKTSSEYAIVGKNVVIESQITADGAAGFLSVTKNFGYVNSIDGKDYVNITNGKFVKMSDEDFQKYVLGQSKVTFDATDGIVSTPSKMVFYGSTYGSLPTPTREYYSFDGWYTAKDGGTKITESSVVDTVNNITLYAHWTKNPTSDWVLASEAPAGATIVDQKWTYDLTSKTSSSSSSLAGWTKYDTKRTGWGGTQGPVYSDPSNGARNVWSEQYVSSYTHHWCYYHRHIGKGKIGTDSTAPNSYRHVIDLTYALEQYTGYKSPTYGYPYGYVYCGDVDSDHLWLYDREYDSPNYSTRWYYQEPIYTYYYTKTEHKESNTEVKASDSISNVQKYVKYVAK